MRKLHGPVLDKLYARLKPCGDLSCTGAPFTEHRNIPALTIDPASTQPAWQQVAGALAEAIQSGTLAPADELPSITGLSALQGIGTGVIRHALATLAVDGLITVRHGRTAVVGAEPGYDTRPAAALCAAASRPVPWRLLGHSQSAVTQRPADLGVRP